MNSNEILLINERFSYYQIQLFLSLQKFIIDLQIDLKQLKFNFDCLYKLREESIVTDETFAVQLNNLAMCEDHPLLSSAFIELAVVQTKLEQINSDYTQQEFLLMNELINEYVLHLDMVQYAFNERAKAYKSWRLTIDTLQKKMLVKVRSTSMQKLTFKIHEIEFSLFLNK
jgi:hypothetical protein